MNKLNENSPQPSQGFTKPEILAEIREIKKVVNSMLDELHALHASTERKRK